MSERRFTLHDDGRCSVRPEPGDVLWGRSCWCCGALISVTAQPTGLEIHYCTECVGKPMAQHALVVWVEALAATLAAVAREDWGEAAVSAWRGEMAIRATDVPLPAR